MKESKETGEIEQEIIHELELNQEHYTTSNAKEIRVNKKQPYKPLPLFRLRGTTPEVNEAN